MDLGRVQRAAVGCFAHKGFAATGIRELGAAVGLNSATLYHYVGSKQELLVEIMRRCLETMIEQGRAACAAATTPTGQLAGLVASHVGFTATNPLSCRVAEHELRALEPTVRAEMQALRDHYEQLFTDVLRRGAQHGDFHAPDLSLARLAIMEMSTGVAHWYRPDGRKSLAEVQHAFVAMSYALLGVDADPHSILPAPPPPVRLASEPTDELSDQG